MADLYIIANSAGNNPDAFYDLATGLQVNRVPDLNDTLWLNGFNLSFPSGMSQFDCGTASNYGSDVGLADGGTFLVPVENVFTFNCSATPRTGMLTLNAVSGKTLNFGTIGNEVVWQASRNINGSAALSMVGNTNNCTINGQYCTFSGSGGTTVTGGQASYGLHFLATGANNIIQGKFRNGVYLSGATSITNTGLAIGSAPDPSTVIEAHVICRDNNGFILVFAPIMNISQLFVKLLSVTDPLGLVPVNGRFRYDPNCVINSVDTNGDPITFGIPCDLARFTDLDPALVLSPTEYKYNSATNNRTGTFNEAARNTDPGITNVLDGTAYKIQDTNYTGTYSPDFPDAANVLVADTVDGVAGTFDEAARNTNPGAGNVSSGTAYTIQNVNYTGTLEVGSPTIPGTWTVGGIAVPIVTTLDGSDLVLGVDSSVPEPVQITIDDLKIVLGI